MSATYGVPAQARRFRFPWAGIASAALNVTMLAGLLALAHLRFTNNQPEREQRDMSTYLGLKWTTSRARDTYGYNVVTLTDERTGKRYRAMGGGYDMVGTVFGEWLQDTHQNELRDLAARVGWEDATVTRKQVAGFYGAFNYPDGGIVLDGGCGLSSMQRIAEALGLEVERTFVAKGRNRGETTGWFVS